MFLNSVKVLGLGTLGTGVTISSLKISGQHPCLIEVLITSVIGTAIWSAKCFKTFDGMSPLTLDLLTSIFFKASTT